MNNIGIFVKHSLEIAQEISSSSFLLLTETGEGLRAIEALKPEIDIIVATPSNEIYRKVVGQRWHAVKLPYRGRDVISTIQEALVLALDKSYISEGDEVVVLGSTPDQEASSLFFYSVDRETLNLSLCEFLRKTYIKQEIFQTVLEIAMEIGREGREGRLIGTAFIIGNENDVMKRSKQIILNPFKGHSIEERAITSPKIKETVKEFSQLDGVFVISKDGIIQSAGVYINVDTGSAELPQGLGARHAAVAALTTEVDCIGITVSQSGGIVRVFKNGKVALTIEPQKRIFISKC